MGDKNKDLEQIEERRVVEVSLSEDERSESAPNAGSHGVVLKAYQREDASVRLSPRLSHFDGTHGGNMDEQVEGSAPKRRRVRRRRQSKDPCWGEEVTESTTRNRASQGDATRLVTHDPRQVASRTNADYKMLLTELYGKYKPEKVKHIDDLLRKYRGQEHEVYSLVCKKYSKRGAVRHGIGESAPLPAGNVDQNGLGKSSPQINSAQEDVELVRRFEILQELRHQLRTQRAMAPDAESALWGRFNKLTR